MSIVFEHIVLSVKLFIGKIGGGGKTFKPEKCPLPRNIVSSLTFICLYLPVFTCIQDDVLEDMYFSEMGLMRQDDATSDSVVSNLGSISTVHVSLLTVSHPHSYSSLCKKCCLFNLDNIFSICSPSTFRSISSKIRAICEVINNTENSVNEY